MSNRTAVLYFVLFVNALTGALVSGLLFGLDARNPLLWAGALYSASNVLLSMLLPGGKQVRPKLPPHG